MWAGARCSAVALVQGWGPVPPIPGVAAPGAWLGGPFPPPRQRYALYTPFPSRECVSLSLQTRRVLARSSRPALGEFRSFAPHTRFALFLCFLATLVALTAVVSLRSPPLCGFFPHWTIVQANKSHHTIVLFCVINPHSEWGVFYCFVPKVQPFS